MKNRGKRCHKSSQLSDILHWIGFSLFALGIILLTAYGFSLSLRPNSSSLESAPEAPEASLAFVGVALSNNVGTDIARANNIPVELPADVVPVQNALVKAGITHEGFFETHFTKIATLQELLAIDVVSYLKLQSDKSVALEQYIEKLQKSKEDAKEELTSLEQLLNLHKNAITPLNDQIKNKETAIQTSYKNRDGSNVTLGLIELEELQIEMQEHKNIVIFSGRLGSEYSILLAAITERITVLQANIAPLVAGVTVKLPL